MEIIGVWKGSPIYCYIYCKTLRDKFLQLGQMLPPTFYKLTQKIIIKKLLWTCTVYSILLFWNPDGKGLALFSGGLNAKVLHHRWPENWQGFDLPLWMQLAGISPTTTSFCIFFYNIFSDLICRHHQLSCVVGSFFLVWLQCS